MQTKAQVWRRQDAMIRSLLISSLSEDVLPLVIGKKTSKDIWNTLSNAFCSPSESRLMSLHMALQELKQRDDETVSCFHQRVKTIVAELKAAGDDVRTSTFNMHIYKGLKPDFQSVVSSLLTRTNAVEYDYLHAILLSHEFLQGSAFNKITITEDSLEKYSPQANNIHRGSRLPSPQFQSSHKPTEVEEVDSTAQFVTEPTTRLIGATIVTSHRLDRALRPLRSAIVHPTQLRLTTPHRTSKLIDPTSHDHLSCLRRTSFRGSLTLAQRIM